MWNPFSFSAQEIKETAAQIVGKFIQQCPPQSKVFGRKGSETVIGGALEAIYREASDFAKKRRLGVIGKARFAKAFQDELQRAGYTAELVSKVTTALTVKAFVRTRRD